jgi:hypothetical protein
MTKISAEINYCLPTMNELEGAISATPKYTFEEDE